jgi:hypothetical protein
MPVDNLLAGIKTPVLYITINAMKNTMPIRTYPAKDHFTAQALQIIRSAKAVFRHFFVQCTARKA